MNSNVNDGNSRNVEDKLYAEKSDKEKIKELDDLRISELNLAKFEKIQEYVQTMELILESDLNEIQVLESFPEYGAKAKRIIKRIDSGDFAKDLKRPTQRTAFRTRIRRIMLDMATIGKINNTSMVSESKRRYELDKMVKVLNAHIDEAKNVMTEEKEDISQLEHTTLSHVLSLMGIFSAIITMVMSAVITSTSWLNNADNASGIIGFAVPNCIALIAVVVMMTFVYLYIHRGTVIIHHYAPPKEKKTTGRHKEEKKNPILLVIAIVILVSVIALSVASAFIALAVIKDVNKPHERYIISESEYRVIEEDKGDSVEKYYVFEIDGVSYRCEYDESFKNDGKLYFCKEHGVLEK